MSIWSCGAAAFNPMAMLHEVNIPLETPLICLRRVCVNLFFLYNSGGGCGGANGSVKPEKSRAALFVDIDSRHVEYKCRFSTAARRRRLLTPAEGCEPITGWASGLSSQFEPLRWGRGWMLHLAVWIMRPFDKSLNDLRWGGSDGRRRRRGTAFCFRFS